MPTFVTPDQIEVRVLGPVHIEVDGDALRVDTRKATAILTYLMVEQPKLSRSSAIGLLWPDLTEQRARAALRRTLSVLRRSLGGALVTAGDTIALDPSVRVHLDEAAVSAIERAHDHDEACPNCRADLAAAVEIVRGDFMEGFSLRDSPGFELWQLQRSEQLRRRFGVLLARLALAHAAAGDYRSAVGAAERLTETDPLDESGWCLLMRLHAWDGRRHTAIDAYRRCLEMLDRELGVAPLETTTELMEAIVDEDLQPAPHTRPARSGVGESLRVEVLESLAVIGDGASLATLRDVSGRPEDDVVSVLDHLLLEEAVVEAGRGFAFATPEHRREVSTSMRLARRRILHSRAADVLTGIGSVSSAEIGRHLHEGGRVDEAAAAWLEAARSASGAGRLDEAAAHLERMLGTGAGDVAAARELSGDLHVLAGRYGDAIASYQLAASHGLDAAVEAKIGSVYGRAGRWNLAAHHLVSAATGTSGEEAAAILVDLGLVLARSGRVEEAIARRSEAMRLAPADRSVLGHAAFLAGMVDMATGREQSAEANLRQAVAMASQLEDDQLLVAALSNLGRALAMWDRLDEAIGSAEEALAVARRIGDAHAEAAATSNLGDHLQAAGRGEEAAEMVHRTVTLLAGIGLDDASFDPEIWKLTGW